MFLISPAEAQTAEAIHAAAQAGDQIMGLGPIGAVFVVYALANAVVVWVLWQAFRGVQKDLVASNSKVGELAERIVIGLAESRGTTENATRAIEEQGRANDTRQIAMNGLAAAFASLERAIERVLNRLERSA